MNKVYLDEMISGIKSWLVKHDYNYIECNDVPTCLYVDNQKINVLIRTFFRLCPINVRNMKLKAIVSHNSSGKCRFIKGLFY